MKRKELEVSNVAERAIDGRMLNLHEYRLVRWMLEHGRPEAASFLPQAESATATSWRCPCGCASINFAIEGHPVPTDGVRPLADFVFGEGDELSGIFIYEQGGMLAGIEGYGFAGDAPRSLPDPAELRSA
jgi:hypothetical protein